MNRHFRKNLYDENEERPPMSDEMLADTSEEEAVSKKMHEYGCLFKVACCMHLATMCLTTLFFFCRIRLE